MGIVASLRVTALNFVARCHRTLEIWRAVAQKRTCSTVHTLLARMCFVHLKSQLWSLALATAMPAVAPLVGQPRKL